MKRNCRMIPMRVSVCIVKKYYFYTPHIIFFGYDFHLYSFIKHMFYQWIVIHSNSAMICFVQVVKIETLCQSAITQVSYSSPLFFAFHFFVFSIRSRWFRHFFILVWQKGEKKSRNTNAEMTETDKNGSAQPKGDDHG